MKLICAFLLVVGSVFAQTGAVIENGSQPSNSINVKSDCGAKGDGSTDDSGAIQLCINNAPSGKKIYFPNGTYKLKKTLFIRGGMSYIGQSTNAVLHVVTMGDRVFSFPWSGGSNVTINTLTFDQGGIDTYGDGETPNNVRITNCKFQNLTPMQGDWTHHNFIYIDNGLSHSQIDHNSFRMLLPNGMSKVSGNLDYDGDLPRSAIFAWGLDNTSINHNTFDHIYQGVKVCQVLPYEAQNIYIGYNTMTHIHRMGIEIQDAQGCGQQTPSGVYFNVNNATIEHNSFLSWDNYFWSSFGISFANTLAQNVVVRYNLITAPAYYESNGAPAANPGIGIEVGGQPAVVYNNQLSGPWGAAIAVFSGSAGSEVHHNNACNVEVPPYTPTISDEMNPNPTDTYYHDNLTFTSCSNMPPVSQAGANASVVAGSSQTTDADAN
jgi:hypothetical protein